MQKCKLSNSLVAFFSAAFQAFGMYNIHALSNVTEGGVLGATLLLEHWFSISPALSSFMMNAACFFLGWRTLGRTFIAYSLLAAIVGALFIGIGAGLCIRAGGATTGDDALAMSLSHLTKIPIQYIYLVSDLTVLGLSLTYIPLGRISYSLLTVVLSGQIIGLVQDFPGKRKQI